MFAHISTVKAAQRGETQALQTELSLIMAAMEQKKQAKDIF